MYGVPVVADPEGTRNLWQDSAVPQAESLQAKSKCSRGYTAEVTVSFPNTLSGKTYRHCRKGLPEAGCMQGLQETSKSPLLSPHSINFWPFAEYNLLNPSFASLSIDSEIQKMEKIIDASFAKALVVSFLGL